MKNSIRDIVINGNNSVQQLFSDNDEQKFNYSWTGKVIDNVDPLYLGRVKIKIFGFYDDIAENAIPWALPESTYLGSKRGNLVIPEVDTVVRGYFDHGDDHKPIYTAIAANVENYATTELLNHPEEINEYPDLMVLLHTDEGERVTLNRASGEMRMTHRSGTIVTILPTGAISIETATPIVKPGASVTTDIPGANISIAGNVNLKSTFGNIDIEADKGTININAKSSDINLGRNAIDVEINGVKQASPTKRKVNNFSNCLFTGAPHCDPIALPNVNVYV